tara:strand:+ start:1838 stop:2158 length:321 start_codon:yes stop_codon:yes gene_type:complete
MDIIEHVGVPRYLHTDFPLGNPLGNPFDRDMQLSHTSMALELLRSASEANTIQRSPYSWDGDPGWRDDYSKVTNENRAELAQAGEARRALQTEMKKLNPRQLIPNP